jgi:hypothetical protein
MNPKKNGWKFREYHFELKHLTVLFITLLSFQLIITLINKSSIKSFLGKTQEWYQKDSAENLANLTTTSLELLLESINTQEPLNEEEENRINQSFDIIFSQQKLQHNIGELCIIVNRDGKNYAIDDGSVLLSVLFNRNSGSIKYQNQHNAAVLKYEKIINKLRSEEQIQSILEGNHTFHIFVPFVIRGEFVGAVYMKNSPDFSFITNQIISNYDETSILYLSLILLGLLAMYFISTYTVRERDEAQKLLFQEHKDNLKKQINYEKELVFTKRIYHTHHKAEKIMGFIKEDLRSLTEKNIAEVNYRVLKYSNFVSRVIYDMKWFDPPVQTIRGNIYNTNLNEVLSFMVNNIFLRVSKISEAYRFELNLDDKLPSVNVNEFVVWELFEPLIQNSIDHSGENDLVIKITTCHNEKEKISTVSISDNGKGIKPEFLQKDEDGIKKLFLEHVTSKSANISGGGYGCYIAYEISRRCGWKLDAENIPGGGSDFIISIPNNS